LGRINFQVKVLSPIKMMTKTNPTGDLGGRSNPTDQATPEGGGSKVTNDPQGNPVSIRNVPTNQWAGMKKWKLQLYNQQKIQEQWGILKQVFRPCVTKHSQAFRFVAIVTTEIAIENGEPLFSVDYVDPAYDNFLFQLFHILDDNNLEY
jgi:hypothetical protein